MFFIILYSYPTNSFPFRERLCFIAISNNNVTLRDEKSEIGERARVRLQVGFLKEEEWLVLWKRICIKDWRDVLIVKYRELFIIFQEIVHG